MIDMELMDEVKNKWYVFCVSLCSFLIDFYHYAFFLGIVIVNRSTS